MATHISPDPVMLSYADIFAERGSSYDIAMRRYPHARRAEFAQIIKASKLGPGMRIGDVPAGGGYMSQYLPQGVAYESHEPCASFTNHGAKSTSVGSSLLPLPWADGELDAVLSLAGLHHLEDKVSLFNECRRVVRPDGKLVISDVAECSSTARFLDGFVGDHNSTGHEGAFLSAQTTDELREAGWYVESANLNSFCWCFADVSEMADFTRHLFDVVRVPDDETMLRAIDKDLGIMEMSPGVVGMRWELMTIVCSRSGNS